MWLTSGGAQGWRQLDPETGDEAGTTEGDFEVHWSGDYFHGKNLAIASASNTYLDVIDIYSTTTI